MEPLWFEDFTAGRAWETDARTLTASDVEAFADVSGDRNPLHSSDEMARAAGFPGRIAHGVLGLAVTTGLINRLGLTRGTLLAFLGLSWEFRKPLLPGDTVRARIEMIEARRSRAGDRGVVRLGVSLLRADGEVTQEGEMKMLVRTRGGSGAPEPPPAQTDVPQ
jgi:acyl dehydratase